MDPLQFQWLPDQTEGASITRATRHARIHSNPIAKTTFSLETLNMKGKYNGKRMQKLCSFHMKKRRKFLNRLVPILHTLYISFKCDWTKCYRMRGESIGGRRTEPMQTGLLFPSAWYDIVISSIVSAITVRSSISARALAAPSYFVLDIDSHFSVSVCVLCSFSHKGAHMGAELNPWETRGKNAKAINES